MSTTSTQVRYEQDLDRLQGIIYDNLVPKLALLQFYTEAFNRQTDKGRSSVPLMFFLVESLYVDVMLTFYRLLEKNGERNLLKFLSFCEANWTQIAWKHGAITLEQIHAHQSTILAKTDILNNIKSQRDKLFAHSDKEFFLDPEKVGDVYPVVLDDLIDLVRKMQSILAAHSMGLSRSARVSMEGFVYAAARQMHDELLRAGTDKPTHEQANPGDSI